MRRFVLLLAVVAAFGAAAQAATDPTSLVNYQGVLRDASDRPLDGTYDMVFRFFDDSAAGNEILSDRHTASQGGAVVVSGGLFNVQLGSGAVSDGSGAGVYASLADVFRDYSDVWLSVQVGSETLSPRTRIVSSATALNARHLGGKSASDFASLGASQTFTGTQTFAAPTTRFEGQTDGDRVLSVKQRRNMLFEVDELSPGVPANTGFTFGSTSVPWYQDRNDNIMCLGAYNWACGGNLRLNPNEWSWANYFETNYEYNESSGKWFEWNMDFFAADGQTHWRPWYWAFNTSANGGSGNMAAWTVTTRNGPDVTPALRVADYPWLSGGMVSINDPTLGTLTRPASLTAYDYLGNGWTAPISSAALALETRLAHTSDSSLEEFNLMVGTLNFENYAGANAKVGKMVGAHLFLDTQGTALGRSVSEQSGLTIDNRFRGVGFDSLHAPTMRGINIQMDFSGDTNRFRGALAGLHVASIAGKIGNKTSADEYHGMFVGDAAGFGTTNSAITVDAQSGNSASKGNFWMRGGDWNNGHIELGWSQTGHLWFDQSTSRWRQKGSAPSSATDGSALTADDQWNTAAKINAATTDDDFLTLAGAQTVTGAKSFTGTLDVQGNVRLAGRLDMQGQGPDADQAIYFFDNGSPTGQAIEWQDGPARFNLTTDLRVAGDISSTGVKNFVQNHPEEPSLAIVYTALEGGEAATYTRGTARLDGGVARVALDPTFAWTTYPDAGLTVNVTPRGAWAQLYVESVGTREVVVRAAPGSPPDAEFDYCVYGLRIGFENAPSVELRRSDASIPAATFRDATYRDHPDWLAYSPVERFAKMAGADPASASRNSSEALTLRRAIGERDPGVPALSRAVVSPASGGGWAPAASEGGHVAEAVPRQADRVTGTGGATPTGAGPIDSGADLAPVLRATSFRSVQGDLARYFPVGELVSVGDVLVSDPDDPRKLRRGRIAADPGAVGIVAGEPGLALGEGIASMKAADPDLAGRLEAARERGDREVETALWASLEKKFHEAHAPVALSGIVACKVDASYGAIRRGDLLTVSPTPGHAMRSPDGAPGTVIGKALEAWSEGTGLIRVLVMLR